MLGSDAEAKITDPFNLTAPKFQPQSGSPVFNASYWVLTSSPKVFLISNDISLQNYPNPFSGTTTIELSVEKTTRATLTVHNLSGQLVDILFQGEMTGGIHSFIFNARSLPKGIYFTRFRSAEVSKTLKMVLQ
jgi:hypothetical protein